MTWRELNDFLSQEWKMLVEHKPKVSPQLVASLPAVDRYVELAIEDFAVHKQWPPAQEDVMQALFLRVDFAIQALNEMPPDEECEMSHSGAMHMLLVNAWHECGRQALIESLG